MGNTFDLETDYRGMERLTNNSRNNILGIQGELWSETIKGPDILEYYYLPKLLGLAERAWALPLPSGKSTGQAWEVFANTLGQRELKRLDHLSGGYNYRLPPPGAKIIDGKVSANVAFPGLSLRYTVDGSEPGPEDPLYAAPVPLDSLVCFKTFDQRGRSSRMVCVGP